MRRPDYDSVANLVVHTRPDLLNNLLRRRAAEGIDGRVDAVFDAVQQDLVEQLYADSLGKSEAPLHRVDYRVRGRGPQDGAVVRARGKFIVQASAAILQPVDHLIDSLHVPD